MKIDEYLKNNGVKITFICKKSGISRDTINRVRWGHRVTEEIANKIRSVTCREIEIETVDTHIRNRSKIEN